MAKLGRDERAFCRHHGIPESRIFDATGLRPRDFSEVMKAEEKWAAFGVTKCLRAGHELRNRHNTCLMCNPASVAYLLRTKVAGFVYVARGAGDHLMKIGYSNDQINRLAIANYERWGGFSDWRLGAYCWDDKAGDIEVALHRHFRLRQQPLEWIRNGSLIVSREAFTADIVAAIEQLVLHCRNPPSIWRG